MKKTSVMFVLDWKDEEYKVVEDPKFLIEYLDILKSTNSSFLVYDKYLNEIYLKANNVKSLFYYYENKMVIRITGFTY